MTQWKSLSKNESTCAITKFTIDYNLKLELNNVYHLSKTYHKYNDNDNDENHKNHVYNREAEVKFVFYFYTFTTG